jgi:hypothetical protein
MMAGWPKKKPHVHIPVRPAENACSLTNYSEPEGWEPACIARSAKRESIFLFRIQNWLHFSPSCLPSGSAARTCHVTVLVYSGDCAAMDSHVDVIEHLLHAIQTGLVEEVETSNNTELL